MYTYILNVISYNINIKRNEYNNLFIVYHRSLKFSTNIFDIFKIFRYTCNFECYHFCKDI